MLSLPRAPGLVPPGPRTPPARIARKILGAAHGNAGLWVSVPRLGPAGELGLRSAEAGARLYPSSLKEKFARDPSGPEFSSWGGVRLPAQFL